MREVGTSSKIPVFLAGAQIGLLRGRRPALPPTDFLLGRTRLGAQALCSWCASLSLFLRLTLGRSRRLRATTLSPQETKNAVCRRFCATGSSVVRDVAQ